MKLLTLGSIRLQDEPTLHQHQPLALLAYLAHNGTTSRRDLATIFWPHAKNPLNSLSSALTRIRQVIPDVVHFDAHQVGTNCTTDALELLAMIEDGEPAAAVDAYGGAFLETMRVQRIGVELEEWIFATRENLTATVAATALRVAERYAAESQPRRAADYAERAFKIGGIEDCLDSEVQFLFDALANENRVLAHEVSLAARALDIALDTTAGRDAKPSTPTQPSGVTTLNPGPGGQSSPLAFSGRVDELAELQQLLVRHDMVNLFGLGGIGKSTLIDRFLHNNPELAERYPGGIHRITLTREDDGGRLWDAITDALDLQGADPLALDALDERVLLVLDDIMPTESVTAVLERAEAASAVHCLVASRLRLRTPGTTALHLHGLDCDSSSAPSPAAQLFLNRAHQLAINLDTGTLGLAEVDKICSYLSGVPLAIKLTAAWLPLVPVADILGLLDDEELMSQAPPGEDVPLNRVIEQTWRLLDEDRQSALTDLSVMGGTFDREAARSVAGAGMVRLMQLLDTSLLDVDEAGRFKLHALVQSFAARQLASDPDAAAALMDRHRSYFIGKLTHAMTELEGPQQGEAISRLTTDHRNIEAAWSGLLEAKDWPTLRRALKPLNDYLLRSGQLTASHRLHSTALAAIQQDPDGIDMDAELADLPADVANNLAWANMLMGRDADASVLCERGLSIVPDSATHVRIKLLRTRCALLSNSGELEAMYDGYQQARSLLVSDDDPRLRALLDEDIGRSLIMLGRDEEAVTALRTILDTARALHDPHMEARSYLLLAKAMSSSDPAHAQVLFDEGEQLAKTHGFRHLEAYFPRDRGEALLANHANAEAAAEFACGVTLADELGDHLIRSGLEVGMARALIRQGELESAAPHLQMGLRLALKAQLWPHVLGAAMTVSNHVLAEDPGAQAALQLYHFAINHPQVAVLDARSETVTDHPPPDEPLSPTSRLDETAERLTGLLRTQRHLAPLPS